MTDLARDLARQLNPQQLEAVQATEGPVLVFAGAGSGKTRVITFRAAHLVADLGIAPWNVMCVTFTNKATGEMRARCGQLLGESTARDLWISTFHATGARLLRKYHDEVGLPRDFTIYDESDQRVVVERVCKDLGIDDKELQPRAALARIERAKQEVVTPQAFAESARTDRDDRIAEVYANYEQRLARHGAVDFGDLLARVVLLLEKSESVRAQLQHRFRYLMVDEFQDTNAAQYRIVRALVGPERNLCVVGDDDQAIYRWRGADVRNIEYFRRDFPDARVIMLEENYRSTANILQAANGVIQKLHTRQPKVLFTHNDAGAPIELITARDEREEAMQVASRIRAAHDRGAALADFSVFYRINAQSRPLEEAMRAASLPYVVVGGMRFFDRAEIKDALAYLRLLVSPNDDVSFLRVVNQPARGIGKTTLERLITYAGARGVSLASLLASGDFPADVQAAARRRLQDFAQLAAGLRTEIETMLARPADVTSLVLDRTGYLQMLSSDDDPENESRRQNLQELIGSMVQYTNDEQEPSLSGYLERVTLADAAAAEAAEKAPDRVTLMTVHSAKGLEFHTVFVTGLEERTFPYKGLGPADDREELEEERRLMYVAITRARKQLVLSHARFRTIFGSTRCEPPSRFLGEIPATVMRGAVADTVRGVGSWGASPSRPPPAPQGVHVVYDEPMQPAQETLGREFRRGMRVKHAKFGVGTVKLVEPGSELKLTVHFPAYGEKRVLADMVRPL